MVEMFFNFAGRLNRWAFIKRSIILVLVDGAIHFLMGLILGTIAGPTGVAISEMVVKVVDFAVWCSGITLLTRRLHDLNRSGWWQIIFQIPFVITVFGVIMLIAAVITGMLDVGLVGIGIIAVSALISLAFSIWTYCIRGTEGPNDYGPDPLAPVVAVQETPQISQEKQIEATIDVPVEVSTEAKEAVPAEASSEVKEESTQDAAKKPEEK